MNFRTELKLGTAPFEINYDHELMLVGSCFSDNIGDKLKEMKMKVISNPFGISFNPYSIAQSVSRIIQNKEYTNVENYNNLYFSYDHHSSFSSSTKEETLMKINTALREAHDKLKQADFIFITLGSAWVYRHIVQNRLVANCHKIPNKEFAKELLSIENITETFNTLLSELKAFNPKINLVFTVSPVRHLKDGFIENFLKKTCCI
ncbi:MAG: GSCFA domain-containing protein [Flavobacteriales bacterium]